MWKKVMKTAGLLLLLSGLMTGCSHTEKQQEKTEPGNGEGTQQGEEPIRAVYLTNQTDCRLFINLENDAPFFGTVPDEIYDEKDEKITPEKMQNGDVYDIYGDQIMLNSYPGQYPGITKLERVEEQNQEYIEKYGDLLNQFCPEPDTSQPPELSVSYRQPEAVVTAAVTRGGYNWTKETEEGEPIGEIADTAHILEWGEDLTGITLSEETDFTLVFTYEPQSVEVKRWPESERREAGSSQIFPEGEPVQAKETKEGFAFRGTAGNVYQISGTWEEGTVDFGFYTASK